jgi:hypothetical protein
VIQFHGHENLTDFDRPVGRTYKEQIEVHLLQEDSSVHVIMVGFRSEPG